MSIEKNSLFKLSYGLFALFTFDGERHNACIVNTVAQLTDEPLRVSVCINRENYSCETALKSRRMNVSVLDESSEFELYKHFGFQSGRDTDKLEGLSCISESENGLKYLTEQSNAFISLEVESIVELETHIIFICRVSEAKVLSSLPSATYAYYHQNIKPAPTQQGSSAEGKKIVSWRCKICNYVYEGEKLPEDLICPWCKHPASDFEPVYG